MVDGMIRRYIHQLNLRLQGFKPNRNGAKAAKGHIYYQTASKATTAAKEAGFHPVRGRRIHNKIVYYNSKTKKYITRDVGSGDGKGSHNSGVWKMANSIDELGNKNTRLSTYDANFKKIGD